MKKRVLFILYALPLWVNAQTIQVLDRAESYLNGKNGVKYEYQYDTKGIAVSETYSFWNSGENTWMENKRCEYQYDNNNNQTWVTLYWNSSSNMWIKDKKYEYQYVDNINRIWITFFWNNSTNMWVENKKYEYQYEDNKTLETYYLWDNSTQTWIEISTAEYNYYYSTITLGVSSFYSESQVTVFPNPATNHITIKGISGSIITASTLSGSIIYKQVMAGESKIIDVSSWASGTYLIFVETENNRSVSKIIKH